MDKETITRMSEIAWAMFRESLGKSCKDCCPIADFCKNDKHITAGCHGAFFDWLTEGEEAEIDVNANSRLTLEELYGGSDDDN